MILAVALLLLAYLAWEAWRTGGYVRQAVGVIERAHPYEQQPVTPQLHILVDGDSTAYGTGAVRPQDSVAGRLGQLLPQAQITNQAKNGMKSRELADRFDDIAGPKFDLMVLHIGANDILRLTPYTHIRQNFRSILGSASASSTYVVFYTSGNIGGAPLLPWFARGYYSHRSRVVHDIAREESAKFKNVYYMDIYQPLAADAWAKDPAKYYAEDRLHPSSAGYAEWFEALKATLAAKTDWL